MHRSHLLSIPSFAFSACCWLVAAYKVVYQQPFKTSVYFIVVIVPSFKLTVQTIGRRPPPAPPPARWRCLSSASLQWPPTVGLIVVSNHYTAATGQPPLPSLFFLTGWICWPKRRNQQRQEESWLCAPDMDPWGATSPWFGATAALPMEREGKAAGG